jgi:uncharacterized protein YbjT (DUF2867 family)
MITITGASGKTGSAVAEALLKKGEKIRVIGRSLDHLVHFREKGAVPFVGNQADVDFLTNAFTGADAAYLLVPPKMDAEDVRAYYHTMGAVAIEAIKRSGLKKLVFLSSLGAEQETGTGPVLGLHDVEKALDALTGVDIIFLRPGYFYENTLMGVELIKRKHINGGSAGADTPVCMVAARDIGRKAAEILAKRKFTGHTVEELFGEQTTFGKITEAIGKKLAIPHLTYVQFGDKESIENMTSMGVSKNMAEAFVELAHGLDDGKITVRNIDPKKPNAPTKYHTFIDEVLYPTYQKAA